MSDKDGIVRWSAVVRAESKNSKEQCYVRERAELGQRAGSNGCSAERKERDRRIACTRQQSEMPGRGVGRRALPNHQARIATAYQATTRRVALSRDVDSRLENRSYRSEMRGARAFGERSSATTRRVWARGDGR